MFALRPDYRALLIAVEGSAGAERRPTERSGAGGRDRRPGGTERAAGRGPSARRRLAGGLPCVRREAAAHPQQPGVADPSGRDRTAAGEPVDRPVQRDLRAHQVPLGGEDLARYSGPPRLLRATGDEPFDTVAGGVAVVEHPEPGEVVWCDDTGVTCRRWNWRQARRTQLREDTTTALFILDALEPTTDDELSAAADDLLTHLTRSGPAVRTTQRLITAETAWPLA